MPSLQVETLGKRRCAVCVAAYGVVWFMLGCIQWFMHHHDKPATTAFLEGCIALLIGLGLGYKMESSSLENSSLSSLMSLGYAFVGGFGIMALVHTFSSDSHYQFHQNFIMRHLGFLVKAPLAVACLFGVHISRPKASLA